MEPNTCRIQRQSSGKRKTPADSEFLEEEDRASAKLVRKRVSRSIMPITESPEKATALLDFVEKSLADDRATLTMKTSDREMKQDEVTEYEKAYELKVKMVEECRASLVSYGKVVSSKREELKNTENRISQIQGTIQSRATAEEKSNRVSKRTEVQRLFEDEKKYTSQVEALKNYVQNDAKEGDIAQEYDEAKNDKNKLESKLGTSRRELQQLNKEIADITRKVEKDEDAVKSAKALCRDYTSTKRKNSELHDKVGLLESKHSKLVSKYNKVEMELFASRENERVLQHAQDDLQKKTLNLKAGLEKMLASFADK